MKYVLRLINNIHCSNHVMSGTVLYTRTTLNDIYTEYEYYDRTDTAWGKRACKCEVELKEEV